MTRFRRVDDWEERGIKSNRFVFPQVKGEAVPQQPSAGGFVRSGNLFLPDIYVTAYGGYAPQAALIRQDARHPEFTLSDGKVVHRPSTFRELIELRTVVAEDIIAKHPQISSEDLETLLKATDVFNSWFWTCTAIAYLAESTKFKVIPASEALIAIPESNTDMFLALPYAAMQGIELDSKECLCGVLLTKDEFLNHQGWDGLLEHDIDLKSRYANIIYTIKQNALRFWLVDNPKVDQVRALCALDLYNDAVGNYILNVSARFLRVGPNSGPPQGGGAGGTS